MAREIPMPGDFYRHFKDKKYEILTVATHSETEEQLVVYRALYGDYKDYVRPLAMFLSEVDHDKYPEVTQKYRFEKIGDRVHGMQEAQAEAGQKPIIIEETENHAGEERSREDDRSRELLVEFLNADSCDEKIEVLRKKKELVTDKFIDDVGVVMDLPIKSGCVEDRLSELVNCLRMMGRYDGRRLR